MATRVVQAESKRNDERVIIHFDYDCFYAAVFEAEDPALKARPLAVQQKQIIVTCNYEARRRGLHKLQLITEAKKVCPDVIIVLGEDLTRFRNASKALYSFLRSFSWSDKVERLGFDEVWMDVTDMIEYNFDLLNRNNLENSFFQISRTDPTRGFTFDASRVAGKTWTKEIDDQSRIVNTQDLAKGLEEEKLLTRLSLASHLALYLRRMLHDSHGYTSTVGISTSKLLSKLIGNVNKPNEQTTLLPPYASFGLDSNVNKFLDAHDIGAVPWIGFKTAQKIREYVLQRPANFNSGLVYGATKESVTVGEVRYIPDLTPSSLEKLLAGPGAPRGIGTRLFGLLNGIDDAEVSQARNVPRQISIEDSYVRLDTMEQILQQLHSLTQRLIHRMRIDLIDAVDPENSISDPSNENNQSQWLAKPEILRLTTRPRLPLNADGTRTRTFKRISRSTQLPNFVFNLSEEETVLSDRLVTEALIPLFKKLHPEKSGWNLSLVNVAVTNMIDAGSNSKTALGRNIESMFQKQDDVLSKFKVTDPNSQSVHVDERIQSEPSSENSNSNGVESANSQTWNDESDDAEDSDYTCCPICNQLVPNFAMDAHGRYHDFE